MNLIRQYSGVMSQQMASGDSIGAAKTGADMVGLMLGGLFISMAKVLGGMLIQGLGEVIKLSTSGLLEGLYALVRPLLDKFLNDKNMAIIDKKMLDLITDINDGIDSAVLTATTALNDGTDIMMNALVEHYTEKLTGLQLTMETGSLAIVKPIEDTMSDTEKSLSEVPIRINEEMESGLGIVDTTVGTGMTKIDDTIKIGTNNMQTTMNNSFGMIGINTIPSTFSFGLEMMKSSTDSFTTTMEEYAIRIKSALASAKEEKKAWIDLNIMGADVLTIGGN
jgi:hypothetical protein